MPADSGTGGHRDPWAERQTPHPWLRLESPWEHACVPWELGGWAVTPGSHFPFGWTRKHGWLIFRASTVESHFPRGEALMP